MQPELYLDISGEESGGSLYRIVDASGKPSFQYQHSTYHSASDKLAVFNTPYSDFETFWQMLSKTQWHFMHPLFVHPELRPFITAQLATVNWKSGSQKWQASHQRQWTKVLSANAHYYKPPALP